jgi:uncharacterized delta-60 repeat protein
MKTTQLIRSVVLGLALFCPPITVKSSWAAAGSLDTTFGKGGVVVTSFAKLSYVIPYSIKLQADGKILILVSTGAGKAQVLRYTSAGKLDLTFGKNGFATLPTLFTTFGSMTIQANGQILVAGEVSDPVTGAAAFGVQRLNSNGSADPSFGTGDLAVANLGFPGVEVVLLIQPDGRILLGGQLEPVGRRQPFQTAAARFDATGALDTTFGSGGTVVVPATGGCSALGLLNTGDILVVNGSGIAQFTAAGALEPMVTGGTLVASNGSENPSLVTSFQPNGDYLLATAVSIGPGRNHNIATEVLRFTATGSSDLTFANPTFRFIGNGGTGVEDVPNGIAVQADGKIVVAGAHSTPSSALNALARLTSSGSFDPTFGNNGIVTDSLPAGAEGLEGVIIQTDGKIVVVGVANNLTQLTISRYLGQ